MFRYSPPAWPKKRPLIYKIQPAFENFDPGGVIGVYVVDLAMMTTERRNWIWK